MEEHINKKKKKKERNRMEMIRIGKRGRKND